MTSWPEKTAPTTDASEKRSIGAGVFRRCEGCHATIPTGDLNDNFEVCPQCGRHHKMSAVRWRDLLLDGGQIESWDAHLEPDDPLRFSDGTSYRDRVAASQKRTQARESVEIGRAELAGRPIAFGTFVFSFMGGSMGSVAGEKIARLFERGASSRLPVVLLSASGGARMQEGILSLMQMAKCVAARERLRDAGLPFMSVLLHPTTGGVAASFAFLGDVNIAEPNALIGFAGPRVIENTIRQKLPPGFQRAEFLLEHGMIDLIVSRLEMKDRIATLLWHLAGPLPGVDPPAGPPVSTRSSPAERALAVSVDRSDPIERFRQAQDRARATEPEGGSAVVLATVGADGRPRARVVLMKDVEPRGFCFYTNYDSEKGHDLAACPHAALCFYWPSLTQQVRVEGPVGKLTAEESDAYFRARPRGSQIGAWASDQSRPLASREEMIARAAAEEARFEGGDVPRPPHWGGYLLRPTRIEFWYGRNDRLHERVVFERVGEAWSTGLLYP